MKTGYKPITSQPEFAHFLKNLTALDALQKELLQQVEALPDRTATRKELERDLGFERSGLRLLAKSKWFLPNSNCGSRETYDLKAALRVRVRFSGFAAAPQIRTERKHGNIVSVLKETFWKVVLNSGLRPPDARQRVSKRLAHIRLPRGQRTPPKKYRQFILAALDSCGGSARLQRILAQIEISMKDLLNPVDRDPMPSHPTIPRWQNTAQWARHEMMKDGLLKADSPRGIWEITEAGRQFLKKSAPSIAAP